MIKEISYDNTPSKKDYFIELFNNKGYKEIGGLGKNEFSCFKRDVFVNSVQKEITIYIKGFSKETFKLSVEIKETNGINNKVVARKLSKNELTFGDLLQEVLFL